MDLNSRAQNRKKRKRIFEQSPRAAQRFYFLMFYNIFRFQLVNSSPENELGIEYKLSLSEANDIYEKHYPYPVNDEDHCETSYNC